MNLLEFKSRLDFEFDSVENVNTQTQLNQSRKSVFSYCDGTNMFIYMPQLRHFGHEIRSVRNLSGNGDKVA